jgi:hypothetical protein
MGRRNPILESFNALEDEDEFEELSQDESEEIEDDQADEFLEDADMNELTDEEALEEVEEFDEQQRQEVERSRTRGKASTRGQRATRQTPAKKAARARAPEREREVSWQPANTLDAPPPLPGHEQRWIRFQLGDKNDPRNWSRKMRERWAPRKLETVPSQHMPPTLTHTQLGEVVGVGDLILCHRPAEIGRSRKKFFKAKTDRQLATAERRHVDKVERGDHAIQSRVRRDAPTVGRGRRKVTAQSDE